MSRLLLVIGAAAAMLCLVALGSRAHAYPASYTLTRTLDDPGVQPFPTFGSELAVLGDDILVGSQGGALGGVVYLFDGDSGALIRTFSNPTPASDESFGVALAASGGNVLIGAARDQEGAFRTGAAYLLDGTTGAVIHRLLAPTPTHRQFFGHAVASLANTLLVGAPHPESCCPLLPAGIGKVYVFDATTGSLLRTLQEASPPTEDRFGYAIAVVGDDVAVGAPRGFADATAGAAYLFDVASGALVHTFTNPDAAVGDFFGTAVAAVGDDVLVTAPGHATLAGSNVGAAYLFDATTGALVRTFAHPEPSENGFFGLAAARVGPNVLIGAPAIDRAYLFETATGTLLHTFTHPNPLADAFYGQALASRAGDVVIGAQMDSATGAFTGAAYQYAPALCPPTPAVGCRIPHVEGARVRIKGDPSGDHDRFLWKYRGVGTIIADIGSPDATTGYALCVYDASASPQPLMTPRAPSGGDCGSRPCWTALGSTGYRYRDPLLTPDGLKVGKLRVAVSYATLTTGLSFKGQGDGLGVPALPLTPPVVVQLQNTETAACWESRFSTPILNDATIFKAKSD